MTVLIIGPGYTQQYAAVTESTK